MPVLELGNYSHLGDENYTVARNRQLTQKDFPDNGCLKCHSGIEKIDSNHNFSCEKCHGGDVHATDKHSAHKGMTADPSYGEGFKKYCLKCHQKDYNQYTHSIHYTMSGVINITEYEFGTKKNIFKDPNFAKKLKNFKVIPGVVEYPDSVSQLATHLLRTKCMECHIESKTPKVDGMMRGKGCSACHVYYSNNGYYKGGDKTIRNKKGYPLYHQFTKKIPTSTCLHCHHGNRIGGDFVGLFEKDYHRRYRTDLAHGDKIKAIYGQDYHKLVSDIHYRKGMHCTDCHQRTDLMGDGTIKTHERKAVKVTCLSCHGKRPDTGLLKNIKKDKKGWILISKVTGKKFRLKYYNKDLPEHNIKGHEKVSCVACHSRWMAQDYGYHLIREDYPRWYYWKDYYIQGDPWITEQFFKYFHGGEPATQGYDWLSDKKVTGVWFSGYSLRRWEDPPLGYEKGKGYYPMRPEYQYFISYNDETDNVINSKKTTKWGFAIHSPHTILKNAKTCESCHGNSKVAGIGIRNYDTKKKKLSEWQLYPLFQVTSPVIPGERKLNNSEIKKLINKSRIYKKIRYRIEKKK